MDTVKLSKMDFEDLLIYAQRYSIGRMTYAPHTVCGIITEHLNVLSKNALTVIKRDIELQQKQGNLGSPTIDEPIWLSTLAQIKDRLQEP